MRMWRIEGLWQCEVVYPLWEAARWSRNRSLTEWHSSSASVSAQKKWKQELGQPFVYEHSSAVYDSRKAATSPVSVNSDMEWGTGIRQPESDSLTWMKLRDSVLCELWCPEKDNILFLFGLVWFETRPHCVAQAGLGFTAVRLPQLPMALGSQAWAITPDCGFSFVKFLD